MYTECLVDGLYLRCDLHQRRDLSDLATQGFVHVQLIRLPLRCRCGSRKFRIIVSGRTFRM
jgi:hypothetical protein